MTREKVEPSTPEVFDGLHGEDVIRLERGGDPDG